MSKYKSIVPEDIKSNTFNYNGATIDIICDSIANADYPAYSFFTTTGSTTSSSSPPHFVGIQSNKRMIIDQFDFTGLKDGVYNGWMTIKNYKIQSSMDGKVWDTLYSSTITVPDVQTYDQSCEFNPTICKYIRLVQVSTHSPGGTHAQWLSAKNLKIYGTLALPQYSLYTNLDAYGILKEGEN